ncbi:TPA: hypothetical protein L4S00_002661 [Pseudomonas aeruginosa]|nr:hypothetical protein [Pseudomonas aeruginosa]HBO4700045.1 hypothetical protein [Pseudomonas aeruginosa]
MSIDWSKAPEGTTHYHIGEDINPWRKIEGTVAYEHYAGKWLRVNSFNEGFMPDYYAPIPQETWDGKCLPPVGTVCERRTLPGGDGRYEQVRIIAHTRKGFPVWENTDGVFAGISKFPHLVGGRPEFRPIRTPEQIAAEERAKAIEGMCFAEQTLTVKQAKALFDAGYRRQESST